VSNIETKCSRNEEDIEQLKQLSKSNIMRSCHELGQYGVNISGNYQIDPDGQLIGKPPIDVYCNFSDEGKSTIVNHNMEDIQNVEKCTAPDCFRKLIEFTCQSAVLRDGTTDFGHWIDVKG
jgi:hypothetical protein